VADEASVRGCADGCHAILHLAAIVAESPPDTTFQRVNVEGTRHIVREAERAHAQRLVHVSSLGADRGESPYHQSKRDAEEVARTFNGSWLVVRPGNVYGPGDEQVSLFLRMVRTLPAVPVVGDETRFQPIWAEDLGRALTLAVERSDIRERTLELAGVEQITVRELIDRLCEVTGRNPMRVPLPGPVASLGLRIAEALGVDLPVDSGQLTMLEEGNIIADPRDNALTQLFGVSPTLLDDGLRRLADAQPEQLPSEGVGTLARKRFWANISGARTTPEELFALVRSRFSELTPWHLDVAAEPGTESRILHEGETLTMKLPVRGNIQVRVRELTPRRMTLVTLAGHPLAGAVRFLSEARGPFLRFEIQVYDRPSNPVDWLMMTPVGATMQNATWKETIEHVVEASGGTAPRGVQFEESKLDDEESRLINEWLDELVLAGERVEREARRQTGDERGSASDDVGGGGRRAASSDEPERPRSADEASPSDPPA
jgi:NADH dehydrogenase